MANYMNFTEALMEAKRRAQLQGRPISEQETRGITEGFAKSAAATNIAEQGLSLQEKGLEAQKSQFAESLAQRKYETEKELEAAEKEREHQKMRGIASGVGTVAGGIIGAVYGGGYGGVAGAAIGSQAGGAMYEIDPLKGVAKGIFGNCIIISACTSPYSYEVQVAREYRDQFMDEQMLFGYYFLCELIVPAIRRFSVVKTAFKKFLVEPLVDFGEWRLGKKGNCPWLSCFISNSFLGFCLGLGKSLDRKLEVIHGE